MARKPEPLPKVGEGVAGPAPSPSADNALPPEGKSRWWNSQKNADAGFEKLSPQWANSATGEMERFRRVPVVGRLPWRLQYIVAALGLLAGVIALIFVVARIVSVSDQQKGDRLAEAGFRQAIAELRRGAALAVSAPADAGPVLAAATGKGQQAVRAMSGSGALSQQWGQLSTLVEDMSKSLPAAAVFHREASGAHALIGPSVSRANAALGSASGGEASSARLFVSAIAQWDMTLARVVEDGGLWPASMSAQLNNLNASVNAFSGSSLASSNTPAALGWRHAASAWSQAAPSTRNMMANAQAWNAVVEASRSIQEQANAIEQAIVSTSSGLSDIKSLFLFSLLSMAWVVICLVLLMVIGWKQQRYQALAALAAHEQTEGEIINLMEDLRLIADGDLTHRARVSETPVGTMADMLNETVASLSNLVKGVKAHVEKGSVDFQEAAEATSALVDSAFEDQDAIVNNAREIERIAARTSEIAAISSESNRLSGQAASSAVGGREAVSEAHRYLGDIRAQAEEARNRVERLAQSSREIAGIATLMNEIADSIGVLAMQAALQAARAGEKGQGFRVVADGVSNLAKKSGVASRRVGALIETALGDIDGAAASMRAATKGTDESSRLMDISLEASQQIEETLVELSSLVAALSTIADEQSNATKALDANMKQGQSRVEESQEKARAAAAGVVHLLERSREMAASANRFKV